MFTIGKRHQIVPLDALEKCVHVTHEGACYEIGLRVAGNKSWRWKGARGRGGWNKGWRRDDKNWWRDAPTDGGVNPPQVRQPGGKGRADVGVEFAGCLYCKLCGKRGGAAQSEAKLQSK